MPALGGWAGVAAALPSGDVVASVIVGAVLVLGVAAEVPGMTAFRVE